MTFGISGVVTSPYHVASVYCTPRAGARQNYMKVLSFLIYLKTIQPIEEPTRKLRSPFSLFRRVPLKTDWRISKNTDPPSPRVDCVASSHASRPPTPRTKRQWPVAPVRWLPIDL